MSFTESLEEIVAKNENGLLGIHDSWRRVRLADVCAILNGFPFPSTQFKPSGGFPLIRIRDIERGRTDTHFVGAFDPEFVVRAGDLVVGMDGDFNCATWTGSPALLNQRVCKLSADPRHFDPRLLPYALRGYLRAINARTPSITVKHLSSRTISEIPLPLPPRREQTRLADAIEAYATRLDDAEKLLERAQRNLERYRVSVIKAAVEGRLVPSEAELASAEGRDCESASTLLERILSERRELWDGRRADSSEPTGHGETRRRRTARYVPPLEPDAASLPELPKGWCWATVDQLAHVGTGSTPNRGRTDYWSDGTVPWVSSAVVNEPRVLAPSEFVTESALRECNLTVFPAGTVLLAMYGEGKTRGRATLLEIPSTTNQALAALELNGSAALVRGWLLRCLEHNYHRLRRIASGGVQPNLNLGLIRSLCLPLPPLAKQRQLNEWMDRALSVAAATVGQLAHGRLIAARLRQSTLRWAFEGRLVDQDPTDEPASTLLASIRATRKSSPAKSLKTRSRRKPKPSTP